MLPLARHSGRSADFTYLLYLLTYLLVPEVAKLPNWRRKGRRLPAFGTRKELLGARADTHFRMTRHPATTRGWITATSTTTTTVTAPATATASSETLYFTYFTYFTYLLYSLHLLHLLYLLYLPYPAKQDNCELSGSPRD